MTQAPIPLFQNAAGRVLADPAGFLRLEWSAEPRQLAQTQALFGAVAAGLRRYQWGRVLTNQAVMLPFSPEEQRWLAQEWLPGEGRASGYRFGAIIVSANVLSRLATAFITTGAPEEWLRYRSFDTEEAARTWLLQQK